MHNREAGVTTLCCHAFVEQFPRLSLLIVDLDAAQQCIAIISTITQKTLPQSVMWRHGVVVNALVAIN